MSAPVFVVTAAALVAGRVVVDGAEGHHAARVARLRAGEPVLLVDGAGRRGAGTVSAVAGDRVEVEVTAVVEEPVPAPRFVVVQALPKGDRGELACELMTEVGVDVVVPWAAARCVTRWRSDRAAKAVHKWRTSARSAAKQSRRARFPLVTEQASTAEVCELVGQAALAAVLHEQGTVALAGVDLPPTGDLVLVVGPEGGITQEELDAFTAAGAVVCRLGDTVVRTSTAGAVALAVLSARTRWA
jgi:16S rRNA (uracil1498-N3)-methyltransferase